MERESHLVGTLIGRHRKGLADVRGDRDAGLGSPRSRGQPEVVRGDADSREGEDPHNQDNPNTH